MAGTFHKYDKMGETSGRVGASATGRANAYVVTEKVHGANFCIIAAPQHDVLFAKRTAVIGGAVDAEDFYGCRSQGLLRHLTPLAVALAQRAARSVPQLDVVQIYGELFGGSYPHPDVPAVSGLQPVQVGVWYAPDLRFMAFDVAVQSGGARRFVDFHVAKEWCEESGFLFSSPLFEGSLEECLDFPVQFETKLPARLGAPPLPRNYAEGVVVRPRLEPHVARNGKESGRGLFKRKIPAFSEKQYQNDAWQKGPSSSQGLLDEEQLILMEIAAHATPQRVSNVLSKTGNVDPRDKVACRQLLEDLKEDVGEALEEREGACLRLSRSLQDELDGLCRAVIKEVLVGGKRKTPRE